MFGASSANELPGSTGPAGSKRTPQLPKNTKIEDIKCDKEVRQPYANQYTATWLKFRTVNPSLTANVPTKLSLVSIWFLTFICQSLFRGANATAERVKQPASSTTRGTASASRPAMSIADYSGKVKKGRREGSYEVGAVDYSGKVKEGRREGSYEVSDELTP